MLQRSKPAISIRISFSIERVTTYIELTNFTPIWFQIEFYPLSRPYSIDCRNSNYSMVLPGRVTPRIIKANMTT